MCDTTGHPSNVSNEKSPTTSSSKFDKFREASELLRAVSLLVHDGSDSSRAVAELIRCGELCFL